MDTCDRRYIYHREVIRTKEPHAKREVYYR